MSTRTDLPESVFVWNNEVLFADSGNQRIRKILRNGSTVTIAGTGICGYNGDDQLATTAQLGWPRCVFVSERGEVYIGEQGRVRKILTNGKIVTVAGTGVKGYNGDNQLAINAQIYTPLGIFVSPDDEVYIADYNNHRIRKILKNGMIITIAGTGNQGYNGDDILAINAQLNNPSGVFVSSSNEVFISDRYNHRIRKIDSNGIITTIAGTGQGGYSGDDILAVQSKINFPWNVMVINDEVYIADRGNHRIRKVLRNGIIITIAGSGVAGHNGDITLAINAQLNDPSSIFVSNSNEMFISERNGQRIRKIDSNGTITIIAGNGKPGYSGDIEYNHSEHGIAGRFVSNLAYFKIMKHERDCLYSSRLIGFLPMIELISPQFTMNVLNESFISKLDSKEQEVVQQLIDSILYDQEKIIEYDTIDDILRLLFILSNVYGEFLNLKRNLVTSFIEKLQVRNVFDSLTTIDKYLDRVMNVEEHNVLSKLKEFCFGYIAKSMQQPNCILSEDVRLNKYSVLILRALGTVSLNKTPLVSETPFQNKVKLEQLYNDKKTSDVKIKMKDSFIFCHKTILSSTSQLFKSMFESNSSFIDLVKDTDGIDVFTPECDEEILIYIIKHCYGIEQEIDPKHVAPLIDLANLHEIEELITQGNSIRITFDNFFEIAQCLENELNSEIMSSLVSSLINFAVSNYTELFQDEHDIEKLSFKLLVKILHKMALNQTPSFSNSKKRKQQ